MDFSAIIKAIVALATVLVTVMTSFYNTFISSSTTTTTSVTGTTAATSAGTTKSGSSATGASGTFTFTSYGWGHGIGMSQEGAKVMANAGSNYVAILQHYYTGTIVVSDTSTPKYITYASTKYPVLDFLCRSVKAEIGESAPEAAIKAQAAAIYTYAKSYNFTLTGTQVSYSSSYSFSGTNLEKYVMSYLGMTAETDTPVAKFVTTNGTSACRTVFCASCAGHTTDAKSTWGTYYSYLVPVTTPEVIAGKTTSITATDLKGYILNYKSSITLSDNPAQWIVINSHDCAVSSGIGYVTSMTLGSETMTGYKFVYSVLPSAARLRSHCFTVVYNA